MENYNRISVFFLLSVLIIGFIFQGCEKEYFNNDDFSPHAYKDFLIIENFPKSEYKNEDKEILLEAEQRIQENLLIKNGKMSLSHVEPYELKMDEELFNFFLNAINIANKNSKIVYEVKRLKSSNAEGDDEESDRGWLGDLIYNNCGSETEQECFDNYWSGGGDMELSDDRWAGVSSYAESTIGANYQNGEQVNINGNTYYKNSVSFYDNSEYNCAYGTGTVYFDNYGNAVGFNDDYDFNSMPWGERSIPAEIGTRTIGAIGEAHGAEEYTISYGIHE